MDLFELMTRRRTWIIASAVLFMLLLLNWLYNTSYIEIRVTNAGSQTVSYELLNQASNKRVSFESKGGPVKKRVSRGNYEVFAKLDGSSYFHVTKTKAFLRPTTIEASLTKERDRQFVGNNPEGCSFYDQTVAFSYACNGTLGELMIHTPATEQMPTATENVSSDMANLDIGGIIALDGKRYVYAQGSTDLESDIQEPIVFELSNTGELINRADLEDANAEQQHKISRYRDGFLVYGADASGLKYYRKPGAKPEKITVARPDKKNIEPFSISTSGDTIAVAYQDTKLAERADAHDENQIGKTYVQIYRQGETKTVDIPKAISSFVVCGDKYLCAVANNRLDIYDISGKGAKELYQITNVKSVIQNGKLIAIERESEILNLDVNTRSGSIGLSFDKTTPCGLSAATNGYTVCAIDSKNDKVLLYTDNNKENTSNIDKKVASLLEEPYVDSVSAYKNFVFVRPNVGSLVYNPATKGYGYDEALKAEVAQKLNNFVTSTGFNGYQIINTRF